MISRKRSRPRSISPVCARPGKARKFEDAQKNRSGDINDDHTRLDTTAADVPIATDAAHQNQKRCDDEFMDVDTSSSTPAGNNTVNAFAPRTTETISTCVPLAATAADGRVTTGIPQESNNATAAYSKPTETKVPNSSQNAEFQRKPPIRTPENRSPAGTRVDSHQQPVRFVYESPGDVARTPSAKKPRAVGDKPKTPAHKRRGFRLSTTFTLAPSDAEDENGSEDESNKRGTSKLVPNKERVFARVGIKDESLARIMCTHRDTGEKKELLFKQLNKMDWDDAFWIDRLNSWSSQIHRRAGERRKEVKIWHRDEETWQEIFFFKILIHAMKPENQQRFRMPTREVLTHHFNKFFEGRVLLNETGGPMPPRTVRVPGAVVSKLDRFHPPIQKQLKTHLLAKNGELYVPQITSDMFEPFRVAKKALCEGLQGMYMGKLEKNRLGVNLELIGGPDPELQLWQTFLDAIEKIGTNANVADMRIAAPAASDLDLEGDTLVDDGYASAAATPAPACVASKVPHKKIPAPGTKMNGARVGKRATTRAANKVLQQAVARAFGGRAPSKSTETDLTITESLLGQIGDILKPAYPRRAHSMSRVNGKSVWQDGAHYDVNQVL